MKKIQIKSSFGAVLFEYEKEDNTIKDTVEEAVRQGVILNFANLCWANLYGADLSNAKLSGSYLCGAYLRNSNLHEADLREANLIGANLIGANLCRADLYGVNLYEANLTEANIYDADLRKAKNVPNTIPMCCPSEGSFIAWKKVGKKLVKLEIPEDAKRSSATTFKCRCDKAKVLAITDLNGENPIDEIVSSQYAVLTYKVGELVYPDGFDEDRWNECSHGIHFFIDKQKAIGY